MYRLPRTGRQGYERWVSQSAKNFLATCPDLDGVITASKTTDESVQTILMSLFQEEHPKNGQELQRKANAGLTLRCYVSQPILRACRERACAFGGGQVFNELINRVLNDDGETLVVLDNASREHCILNRRGNLENTQYKFVTVEILNAYDHKSSARLSLQNWAYFYTRRHAQVKEVLTEVGFHSLSDWALLNRARSPHLEILPEKSRHLIQVFHSVYRRDRRQTKPNDDQTKGTNTGGRRCPDPSKSQLEEMLNQLQEKKIMFANTAILMDELHQVAAELRQIDIWTRRKAPIAETLEFYDPDTGTTNLRPDLPNAETNDLEDVENVEMLAFIRQQLDDALEQSIEQGIDDKIRTLSKSRRAKLAPKYIPGLKLYYCKGQSTREIANTLGIPQSQVSRVLSPAELLNQIRFRTTEKLLDMILVRSYELGLTDIPPKPNYLSTLVSQLEVFVDEEVFNLASTELRSGKKEAFISRYSKFLCHYLNQI